jgi:peptidoglycan DL-endopeptidase CwlO
VAVPRPTSPLLRLVAVSGAVAVTIGLTATSGQAVPGPSNPTPTTSAQALTQLRAYNEQFEKVTEQYNDARVLLKKRTAEAKVASTKAQKAASAVVAYRDRVKSVVKSEARSEKFGTFGAMLTSGSAGDFAAQASLIEMVSSRRATVLTAASKASAAAKAASAKATAAKTAAAKLTKDLATKRSDLQTRATKSKALFDKLSASERAAFRAQPAVSEDRGSRSSPRAVDPPPANVPVSGRAGIAVAKARAQLGKPYVWAASGPGSFDCSGLTMYAWAAAGVSLPHSSGMQIGSGTRVSRSELKPGDLVFYGSPIHHVAIYVGGGQVIHAPTSGDVVRYASVDMGMSYAGATRPG